jgi:hypothetical protein
MEQRGSKGLSTHGLRKMGKWGKQPILPLSKQSIDTGLLEYFLNNFLSLKSRLKLVIGKIGNHVLPIASPTIVNSKQQLLII